MAINEMLESVPTVEELRKKAGLFLGQCDIILTKRSNSLKLNSEVENGN